MDNHRITIKVKRSTHVKLKKAQMRLSRKAGRIVPLETVAAILVDAGTRRGRQ